RYFWKLQINPNAQEIKADQASAVGTGYFIPHRASCGSLCYILSGQESRLCDRFCSVSISFCGKGLDRDFFKLWLSGSSTADDGSKLLPAQSFWYKLSALVPGIHDHACAECVVGLYLA